MSQKHSRQHHSRPHQANTLESTHRLRPWLVELLSRAARRPQVWSSTGQKLPSSGQEIYAHTLIHTLARPIVSHFVLNYTLNRIAVAITCGPLFLQPFGQHALSSFSPTPFLSPLQSDSCPAACAPLCVVNALGPR